MQQENCTAQLGQWLAGSENGSVYYCQETEVVSLCLHYMTMRFEGKAFRDLLGMMGFAQAEIQRIKKALEHPTLQSHNRPVAGGALH
jgi:hypothetical protein